MKIIKGDRRHPLEELIMEKPSGLSNPVLPSHTLCNGYISCSQSPAMATFNADKLDAGARPGKQKSEC